MGSVIILSISGHVFLFEAKEITFEQVGRMQELADTQYNGSFRIKFMKETEICDLFKYEAFSRFGITLKAVQVSSVIRINI